MELPNPFVEKQQRQIPLRELVDPSTFVASTINLFSLGYAILGIAVLVSSFDQYRWRSLGIVIGLYVTQLLLFILSKSTPGMGFVKPMTFLSAYQPDWMVQAIHNDKGVQWRFFMGEAARGWQETFGPMGYISVLVLLGSIAYAAGFYRFQTRDLPAPN
jgi:ABC-2 type transport system permease protein